MIQFPSRDEGWKESGTARTVSAAAAMSADEEALTPRVPGADGDRFDRLGDEIATLAAQLHAAEHRLLVRLREFDALFERCGGGLGFRSTAHWLAWRTSMSLGAARERVRVARALGELPLVSREMARGKLSFSKVRALARAVPMDAETEERLVHFALHGTASHLERLVRVWRRMGYLAEEEAERARHERRHLDLWVDEDGSYVVRGRVDPEVGALLKKALELAEEALYRRERKKAGETERRGTPPPGTGSGLRHSYCPRQRRADALRLVADEALAGGFGEAEPEAEEDGAEDGVSAATGQEPPQNGGIGEAGVSAETRRPRAADRFQVVLHVDVETLRKEGEIFGLSASRFAYLDGYAAVSAETARRLSCDAGRVVMVHDAEGNVLDVGRRTRTVPPALARAVDFRDGGRCRFPGCSNPAHERHHVVHWANGGETKLENICSLCGPHHRAIHEDGFTVEGTEEGGFRFRAPYGWVIPEAPRPEAVEGDPVARLRDEVEGALRDRGEKGEFGPWTATPEWDGQSPDLDGILPALPEFPG